MSLRKILCSPIKNIMLTGILFMSLAGMQTVNAGVHTKINDHELIQPKSITVDQSLDKTSANQMIRAARLFYTFWNTGNPVYADAVMSPAFRDNTLPEGRPQGPEGIKFASANFRKAVPDLTCSVEDLLIVGDKVTARLAFHGTFKGKFMGHQPTNKPVAFFAIDILHIKNGQLVEDWHLEDNLSLMKQLDAVKVE